MHVRVCLQSWLIVMGLAALGSPPVVCAAEVPKGPAPTPKLRAVLIGLNDYTDPRGHGMVTFANLNYAVNDVREVQQTLLRHGVSSEQITLFTAEQGRHLLHSQVTQFLQSFESSVDEIVFFMFCGHGLNIGHQSYLCFSDTRIEGNKTTGDLTVTNALGMSQLSDLLAAKPGATKIIVTDACRNWTNDVDEYSKSSKLVRLDLSEHIQQQSQAGGNGNQMLVISSCLPGQVSLEDATAKHGVFARQLLDALDGHADFTEAGNRDGRVSLYEMFQYAARKTREVAKATFATRQNPFFEGGFTQESDLLVLNESTKQKLRARYTASADQLKPFGLNKQLNDERYSEAVESLGTGQLRRAVELCVEILEREPEHDLARELRNFAWRLQGNVHLAVDDAKKRNSTLTIRYSGRNSVPVKGTGEHFQETLHTIQYGDIVEIDRYNSKNNSFAAGTFLNVARIRSQATNEWIETEGWLAATAVTPRTGEDHLRETRNFQLDNHQPVVDQRGGEHMTRSFSGTRVQNGIRAYQDVNARIGEVNGVLNGIPYAPSIPSLPGIPIPAGIGGFFR